MFHDVDFALGDLFADAGEAMGVQESVFADGNAVFVDRVADSFLESVGPFTENGVVFAEDLAAAKAAVDGSFIEDEGVFDVVARVGHDSHDGILTRRKLVVVDEFDGAGFDKRFLRVDH